MDLSNFTTRAQQALTNAVSAASVAGNPTIEPIHVLNVLLDQDGGTTVPLLTAAGVDAVRVRSEAARVASLLPRASGESVGKASPSRAFLAMVEAAVSVGRERGDEFISSENLVVAIAAA